MRAVIPSPQGGVRMRKLSQYTAACTSMVVFCFGAWSSAGGPNVSAPAEGRSDAALQAYVSGNGLLNRGLYDLAIKEYRKFLAAKPNHEKAPMARYGLAVSLFRLGNLRESTEELGQLHEQKDFIYEAEVATMFGQCHLAAERYVEARKAFERVLKKHASHALADDAAAQLVEALYRDDEFEKAIDRYEITLSRWPKSEHLDRCHYFAGLAEMKLGAYQSAVTKFDTIIRKHANGSFALHASLLLAQAQHNRGDFEAASRQYRQVLQRADSPHRPEALLGLATILRQGGKFEAAGELLDQLLSKYPDSSLTTSARLLRGRAWFDLGEYNRAAEAFRAVMKTKDRLVADAAYWFAKCNLRHGDHAGAARDLKQLIRRYPKSDLLPEMIYDCAIALLRDDKPKQAAEKLADYRSRFPDHPSAPDALHLLATIAHQQQDFKLSQKRVRLFQEQYVGHELAPKITYLSAENEYLAGRYKKAAAEYRRFLSKHAQDAQSMTARYRLGMSLYRLKEYDEARKLLSKVVNVANADTFDPMHLALGDIYFQRNEWKDAERHLSAYLSKGSVAAAGDDALLKLGLAMQRQDRFQEAIQQYDRLLEQYDKSPHILQAIFERGQSLVALKQFDDAAETFKVLLAQGGDSRFAAAAQRHLAAISLHRSDFKDAARRFRRVARATKGSEGEAEALFQQGQALMSARDFAAAERVFKKLIKKFPSHTRANAAGAHVSIAMARQDQHENAVKFFKQVDPAKLNSDLRASVKYEYAWCLRALGKENEAADIYRKLIASQTRGELRMHALLELADIEADGERFSEAIELLGQFRETVRQMSMRPADELLAQANYRLGTCHFRLRQYEKSAEVLSDFAERFPKNKLIVSAGFFCGEALFKLGRHEKAIPHFERVAGGPKSDSTFGPSLLRLGDCHANQQQWQQSEKAFAEYLNSFGSGEQWFQAEFGLGWARENQGRHKEAIKAYQRVVDRHQGQTAARAQFQIGQCLFALKQYEDAVSELLKVDILYAYPKWSAAALYEAGRCFEKLMKHAEARQQFETVVEKYKGTQWAGMASQRLSSMTKPSLPGR